MPFDVEYTNSISIWELPDRPPHSDGQEYLLSVAVHLPVWLTLPKGEIEYTHRVKMDTGTIDIELYQDCFRLYYGDLYTSDRVQRYRLFRRSMAPSYSAPEPPTPRLYVEKLRTVAQMKLPIQIGAMDEFVLYSLRQYCDQLISACGLLVEAERQTYHPMAWVYPYQLSFMDIDIFWISLYRDDSRVTAFPFLGNAAHVSPNAPHPAVPHDFDKIRETVCGDDEYPDWWLTYTKAVTLVGQENYRGAILDMAIAVEMVLSRYIRAEWHRRGISKKTIENNQKSITLSAMLNIEWVILAEQHQQPSEELRGNLNQLRRVRNEIVHEGRWNVSKPDAQGFLDSVKEAIMLIAPSIYDGKLLDSVIRNDEPAVVTEQQQTASLWRSLLSKVFKT